MRINRRTFLFRGTAGAAALGALAVAPHVLGTSTSVASAATIGRPAMAAGTQPQSSLLTSNEPVFVHVRDRAKGEIALYVGTREIVRHDPDLVSRLLQAGA